MHDRVNQVFQEEIEKRGWTYMNEPPIPTPAGIRKPDIDIWKGACAKGIDTSIVSDVNVANLEDAFGENMSIIVSALQIV